VERRNYSTFAVAEILGVDPGSVVNWIDSGLLKAFRTPGGHRRVSAGDLHAFLVRHNMPVPAELATEDIPVCVAVVDDEPELTRLVSRAILAKHPDYQVIEAHDGFQAGTLVSTHKPRVVILDLKMPGIDGFEVCRMIKTNEVTKHATVIAITAYASPENQDRILNAGARICLEKPLDLDELVGHVEAAIADGAA
jgi:excisionase family DNA binding protein